MKLEKIKDKLREDGYKAKSTIDAIVGGRSKPNAGLRYKYEKELGIPFDDWGDKIRNHIEEACSCCGTILKKKEKE